jgi:hypothetical protein
MSIPGAVTIFLNQVALEGGIPFEIKLPQLPQREEKMEHTDRLHYTGYYYCCGVQMPDFSYDSQAGYNAFCSMLQPGFKSKACDWWENAKTRSKEKEGESWKEEFFKALVIQS